MTATHLATAPAPVGQHLGLPLYKHGTAPARLRTVTRLAAIRLQPAPGQRPVCYVIPYYHPDERRALYEPADAAPIVRALGDEWAWRARRTCPRCGEVREHVVHGRQCGKCAAADRTKSAALWARTCSECRRVGSKPYPEITVGAWNTQRLCRFCAARSRRRRRAMADTADELARVLNDAYTRGVCVVPYTDREGALYSVERAEGGTLRTRTVDWDAQRKRWDAAPGSGPAVNAYFGETWDVPAIEGQPHVDTPVGVPCAYCTIPVEDGDRGFMIGCVRLDAERRPYGPLEPWHRECLMRSTVGSPAHLDGRCTCHGEPGGEDSQTPAQVRAEAIEVWDRIVSGRF